MDEEYKLEDDGSTVSIVGWSDDWISDNGRPEVSKCGHFLPTKHDYSKELWKNKELAHPSKMYYM